MQIFKQIIDNECVNKIPLSKAIIWQILRNNWKTVRDSMYFSIIHFEIAYRLSIDIKISDLWMTLNGLMTADERHLRGSWFFYVAFTIWPKIGLGHET